MSDERVNPEVVTPGARIQTFLIADVRGYTLFTQQRGDEAAAKLAAKFAEIARETVQRFEGNVIELRGDEALAVFASARQAVRAAVDLQERLVEETIDDPELPLPVGIGLDAGEAVPVEEGYRGGALNLAARLCGQAGPGEILASRGVTHLAQRVDGVRFVDRGRVQLKNLTEPVEVVRVVPEGVDPAERLRAALPPTGPPRRRSKGKTALAAVVALALAIGAAIVLLPEAAAPTIPAGSVGLLDLAGGLEGTTVDVGEFPRGLAMGAGALWATDQESDQLIQVDPSTHDVEARIPVGDGPTSVAIAAGYVFVANTDERTVSVVNPRAQVEVERVDVGNGPAGIVADGERVWVTNSVDATVSEIDVSEIDTAESSVTGTYPVGEWPVALAVGAGAVWVANEADGTVSRVVSGQGQTESIPVGRGPAAIAFAFGSLWVANAEDGTVTTIDPARGSSTTERVGESPVALAAAGDDIWVASAGDGAILRIDPATTQVTDTYEVGNQPRALTGTEDGLWIGVEASPAVHRGGTLKLVAQQPVNIDPHDGDFPAASVLASMYDGLVTYRRAAGAAGQAVVPDLAVSVPAPSDAGGLMYTFTLREGISFSNGHALTPEDVVASFERILIKGTYSGKLLRSELVGGSSCTGKDPEACDLSKSIIADEAAGTVTFHLIRRLPDFPSIIAQPGFEIVPAGTPIDLEGEPIPATGPYVIRDVGQDGSMVLERNETFREWSSDAQPDGFADRIEVMTGVDAHEQVDMIERGEADVSLDYLPDDLLEALERHASDQLQRSQYPAVGTLALNTATYPFNSLDARKAVAFALDRAELNAAWVQGVPHSGQPEVTCQILPPNTPGYAPYCPYTNPAEVDGKWAGPDLSRANALVESSRTKRATVTIGMSPCLDPIVNVVADTLRDLEYEVVREIDGPLRPEKYECWFGPLSPDADVSMTNWFNGYPSAAEFLVPLLSCVQHGRSAVTGVLDYPANASNFCDPEIDRRMQRALDLQVTDPHAAARRYESLEHDLLDLAPLVPFNTGYVTWLVAKQASNVEFHMQLLGPIISQVWVK